MVNEILKPFFELHASRLRNVEGVLKEPRSRPPDFRRTGTVVCANDAVYISSRILLRTVKLSYKIRRSLVALIRTPF